MQRCDIQCSFLSCSHAGPQPRVCTTRKTGTRCADSTFLFKLALFFTGMPCIAVKSVTLQDTDKHGRSSAEQTRDRLLWSCRCRVCHHLAAPSRAAAACDLGPEASGYMQPLAPPKMMLDNKAQCPHPQNLLSKTAVLPLILRHW